MADYYGRREVLLLLVMYYSDKNRFYMIASESSFIRFFDCNIIKFSVKKYILYKK